MGLSKTLVKTAPLLPELRYGSYTDKGVREENQDSLLTLVQGEMGVFAVADGAGGHQCGREASQLTIGAMQSEFENNQYYTVDYLQALLRKKYQQINDHIFNVGKQMNLTMVTTLSLLNFVGNKFVLSNVGDTKVFQIRNKGIKTISKVHTVAWEEYEAGKITYEEYTTHKGRHILTQAIGGGRLLQTHVASEHTQKGDIFIICSDGVYNFVTEQELLEVLTQKNTYSTQELNELAQTVVRIAVSHQSDDNMSLVIIQVG